MDEDNTKNEPEEAGQKLQDEAEELKKKADEYLNNWKRSAADFINYKKEEMERAGLLINYAKEEMLLNMLPIIDSFYLSEKHSNILENVGMSEWQKGFEQIKKQIEEFLKKEGIEEIEAIGQKFDPSTMEAVDEEEGDESGKVIEELQKGYKIDEKVLRPAKVKINK